MKNKTLWIIFASLLALFLLSKLFSKKTVRSFTTDIIQIDSTAVDKIKFYNADPAAQFELQKSGTGWKVKNDKVEADALGPTVTALLQNLNSIKAERPVAKSEDKWAEYEVDDIKGKRIELFSGNKKVEDLVIGRFNFNQQTRSAKSYVRRSNDKNVYVVDGFISMTINQSMDAYRNKNVLRLPSDITELKLRSESGTSSARKENYWINNSGEVLDSTVMANYISKLKNISGTAFYDDGIPSGNPIKELDISLSNGETANVKCFNQNGTLVIHSTENQDSYFSSDSTGIFKSLFLDAVF